MVWQEPDWALGTISHNTACLKPKHEAGGRSSRFYPYRTQENLVIKLVLENLQTIILEFDEIQTDAEAIIAARIYRIS